MHTNVTASARPGQAPKSPPPPAPKTWQEQRRSFRAEVVAFFIRYPDRSNFCRAEGRGSLLVARRGYTDRAEIVWRRANTIDEVAVQLSNGVQC